jgi:hypothetical protein
MHPELDPLLKYAARQATRTLRETGNVEVFVGYLETDGTPTFLNLIVDPEYELPTATGGLVEFVRAQVRKVETRAAVFCAPVQLHMTDATMYDGIKLHLDHVEDATAHTVTLPYRIDEHGQIETYRYVYEESDDLIFPR